jgi:hypothetical protein
MVMTTNVPGGHRAETPRAKRRSARFSLRGVAHVLGGLGPERLDLDLHAAPLALEAPDPVDPPVDDQDRGDPALLAVDQRPEVARGHEAVGVRVGRDDVLVEAGEEADRLAGGDALRGCGVAREHPHRLTLDVHFHDLVAQAFEDPAGGRGLRAPPAGEPVARRGSVHRQVAAGGLERGIGGVDRRPRTRRARAPVDSASASRSWDLERYPLRHLR